MKVWVGFLLAVFLFSMRQVNPKWPPLVRTGVLLAGCVMTTALLYSYRYV